MSIEKTKKAVHDFLSNESAEVLSIKGPWGVGKTYFWNEAIKQVKDNPKFCRDKYCYVSLFGIESLAQLKAVMFETYVDKSEIGKGFSFDNLMKKIPRYGRAISSSASSLFNKFASAYLPEQFLPSALPSVTFYMVKDILICIDDFERKSTSLSTKDVLGLISLLAGCGKTRLFFG